MIRVDRVKASAIIPGDDLCGLIVTKCYIRNDFSIPSVEIHGYIKTRYGTEELRLPFVLDRDGFLILSMVYEHLDMMGLIEGEPPIPDRVVNGGVRLWRMWRHYQGQLYPLTRKQPWELKPDGTIECDDMPTRGSSSGFYGFFELTEFRRQEAELVGLFRRGQTSTKIWPSANDNTKLFTYVLGSYIAWGTMVKAEKGARVRFAKPEYLILPDLNEDYAIELMTLADAYGMKPITIDQAKELKTGLIPWTKP